MLYQLWTAYFEHFYGLPTKLLGEILIETPKNHIYTERSLHFQEEMASFLFLRIFLNYRAKTPTIVDCRGWVNSGDTLPDYRHTSKHLRLVLALIAVNVRVSTDGWTDRRYQVHHLPRYARSGNWSPQVPRLFLGLGNYRKNHLQHC